MSTVSAAETGTARFPKDEELLRRARDGDAQASGALISRYRDAMLRFCSGYLGSLQDAEHAAQDVLSVVASGDGLPEGRFRPWLYRAARNRCLNLLKRRKDGRVGAGSFLGDSRWPSRRTGPRTALLRDERGERLRRAMDLLSAQHREVLLLRYFEGLRRTEIAEVLELTETLVRSRLFKASQCLRGHLEGTESWS